MFTNTSTTPDRYVITSRVYDSYTCGNDPYVVTGYEASIEPMKQQNKYIATINYYFIMVEQAYLDSCECETPIQPHVYYDMR